MSTSIKGEQSWLDNTPGGGGGGVPSAPLNSVQYNNAGAFGGNANYLFDGTTLTFKGDTDWNKPVQTTYVRTQDDFGATIDINGNDYLVLDTNHHYILLNDFTWNKGFSLEGDRDIMISSGSPFGARLEWTGFETLANPIIRTNNDSHAFILDNVQILNFNAFPGGANPLVQLNSGLFVLRNSGISGFTNPLNLSTPFQISQSRITGSTGDGIILQLRNGSFIDRCTILSGNIAEDDSLITITGSGGVNPERLTISNSIFQNAFDSYVFNVSNGLAADDTLYLPNNKTTDPTRWFNTGAGSLDQTSSKISALNSPGIAPNIIASGAGTNFLADDGAYKVPGGGGATPGFGSIYSKNIIPAFQAILIMNALQNFNAPTSTLITWIANSVLNDFTINLSTGRLTYTGAGGNFMVTGSALLALNSAGNDETGLGLLHGAGLPQSPILDSIYTNGQNIHFALFKWPLALATNDVISMGLINRNSTTAVNVSEPMWMVEAI